MKLIIGTDHRGYTRKEYIKKELSFIEWIDIGCYSEEAADYPVIAKKAIQRIKKGECTQAILLCGSGIGMSIAANRHAGIFAALAWNISVAKQAKEHENANILVLPSDYITMEECVDCINAWINASFLQGHYEKRCRMIDSLR